MAFKRIVTKSEEDLNKIITDVKEWFKSTKDYKVSFSTEKRKFQDPDTKAIVEKSIDVIKVVDGTNGKETSIKFIPMKEKGEMKIELGGEGETAIAGKISNQIKGKGVLKSYSKDKKVALKESNTIKKSELTQLIKEEIKNIINENVPSFDDLEYAIKQHEKDNYYYDTVRLINIFNQLESNDQQKARKKYSKYF
jgi:hypothetical protein